MKNIPVRRRAKLNCLIAGRISIEVITQLPQ
jgi:hypothetical protein